MVSAHRQRPMTSGKLHQTRSRFSMSAPSRNTCLSVTRRSRGRSR